MKQVQVIIIIDVMIIRIYSSRPEKIDSDSLLSGFDICTVVVDGLDVDDMVFVMNGEEVGFVIVRGEEGGYV